MNPVLDLAIRATAFMLIGALAWRLMRRGSAESRCGVLRATVFGLALLPIAAWVGPRWEPVLPWAVKPAPITVNMSGVDFDLSMAAETQPEVPAPAEIPWGWLAWAGLAAAVTLPSLVGLRSLRRLWGAAIAPAAPLAVEVFQALDEMDVRAKVELRLGNVGSPLVFGARRPHILLPVGFGDWPEAHRRSALLHEAAHIRRFDCAWLTLASAVRAVYACHPLVWWLSGALKDETELAADERAIRSGVEATDYASALVAIARDLQITRGVVRSQGVTFMNHRQLDRRVRGALSTRRRGFTLLGSLSLMGTALATVFGIGSLHPQSPQQEVFLVTTGSVQQEAGALAPSPEVPVDYYMGPDELTPSDYAVHAAQSSAHQKKVKSKFKTQAKKPTTKPGESGVLWRTSKGASKKTPLTLSWRPNTGTFKYTPTKVEMPLTTTWRRPALSLGDQSKVDGKGVPFLRDIPIIGRLFKPETQVTPGAKSTSFSRVPIISQYFQKAGDDAAKPTPSTYRLAYTTALSGLTRVEYKPLLSFTTAGGGQVSEEDSKKARELVEKLLKDAKGTPQEDDLRKLLELISKGHSEPKALEERARMELFEKARSEAARSDAQREVIKERVESKLLEARNREMDSKREVEANLRERMNTLTEVKASQLAREKELLEVSRAAQGERVKMEADLARTLTSTARIQAEREAKLARTKMLADGRVMKIQEEKLAKLRRTEALNIAPLQLELSRIAGRNQTLSVSQVLSQGGVLEIKIVDEKGRVQTIKVRPDQIKKTITLKRDKNGKLQVINK